MIGWFFILTYYKGLGFENSVVGVFAVYIFHLYARGLEVLTLWGTLGGLVTPNLSKVPYDIRSLSPLP